MTNEFLFLSLVERVAKLDGSDYGKTPHRNNIFRGCYDVWHDEEDRKQQLEQSYYDLKRAKEAGFIINHPFRADGSIEPSDLWFLTKKGKELYENSKKEEK